MRHLDIGTACSCRWSFVGQLLVQLHFDSSPPLGWQKIVAQGGDFTAGNGTGGESIYGRLLAVIICEVKNLDFPMEEPSSQVLTIYSDTIWLFNIL